MRTSQRSQFTRGLPILVAVGVLLIGGTNSSQAAALLAQSKGGGQAVLATATPDAESPQPGSTREDDKGVAQVWVPAGCFDMGTDPAVDRPLLADEMPQHQVCIKKGFWLDQYEVTNESYDQFINARGYQTKTLWSKDGWNWLQNNKGHVPMGSPGFMEAKLPRVLINWYESEAYAHWRGGRLPTEAEWEYAARGPDDRIYPWGNDYEPDNLNAENKARHTVEVGNYEDGKSWTNAYDMAGNVWEWVNDWYSFTYYDQKAKNDPQGPTTGTYRVLRGGSWYSGSKLSRTATRYDVVPSSSFTIVGTRILIPEDSAK